MIISAKRISKCLNEELSTVDKWFESGILHGRRKKGKWITNSTTYTEFIKHYTFCKAHRLPLDEPLKVKGGY